MHAIGPNDQIGFSSLATVQNNSRRAAFFDALNLLQKLDFCTCRARPLRQ
jgi:hypothetical protein